MGEAGKKSRYASWEELQRTQLYGFLSIISKGSQAPENVAIERKRHIPLFLAKKFLEVFKYLGKDFNPTVILTLQKVDNWYSLVTMET